MRAISRKDEKGTQVTPNLHKNCTNMAIVKNSPSGVSNVDNGTADSLFANDSNYNDTARQPRLRPYPLDLKGFP